MNPPYKTVAAPAVVYRVARSADPCKLPAWEHILGSVRGRYDDPLNAFRVLYTSTSPIGAVVETLADLRPRYDRIAEIATIGDEDEGCDGAYRGLVAIANIAMTARLAGRYICAIEILDREPLFVDLGTGVSRSRIELELSVERLKIGDLTGRDRNLSRQASRAIFDAGYAGLVAPSAEGPHADTVAIFETAHDTNVFCVRLNVLSARPAHLDRDTVAAAITTLLHTDEFSALVSAELLASAA
jgi:RES domain